MIKPFLTAQVPYGSNGFTMLLSTVSKVHRQLAEDAIAAVPRVGDGMDDTRIYICRSASQEDTGRSGSACLMLTHVDVTQLDEKKRERLKWKLSVLFEDLEDAWKQVPPTSSRDCGPVESPKLREWERELGVDELPPARNMPIAETEPVPNRGQRLFFWLGCSVLVAMFTMLVLRLSEWNVGSGPVVETKHEETKPEQVSQPTDIKTVPDLSTNASVKQPPPKQRKPLSQLIAEWRKDKPDKPANTIPAVAELVMLAAELKKRPSSKEDKAEVKRWLEESFQLSVPPSADMAAEWKSVSSQLAGLAEVAKNPVMQLIDEQISRDVLNHLFIEALRKVLGSQFIRNVKSHCEDPPPGQTVEFMSRTKLDIAIKAEQQRHGPRPGSNRTERSLETVEPNTPEWKLPVNDSVIESIQTFASYRGNGGDTQEVQTLLETLNLISDLKAVISVSEMSEPGGRKQETGELGFAEDPVLQMLHANTLQVRIGNRSRTVVVD